jgi:hypothetical protein
MISTPQPLQVGDVVILNAVVGENEVGSIGLVYERFETPTGDGVSVILRNGHDIGGFTPEEAEEYLTFAFRTNHSYAYQSPQKLMEDYRHGCFDQVFAAAHAAPD